MILILSVKDDQHVPIVVSQLEARGAEYWWFDPADFPTETELCLSYDRSGIVRRLLLHREREVDLATITAVWNRRPGRPQAALEVREEEQRRLAAEISGQALAGVWETLDCLWVSGKPSTVRAAHNKSMQLSLAASLGFRIPRTLITNSSKSFLEFYSGCNGRVITKVAGQVVMCRDGEPHAAFTHVVQRRDAASYRTLRYAPMIVQEYVPKQVELRVTVVGSQVFVAEIHSQASRVTCHDWRHDQSDPTLYAPHTLPPAMATLCLRLVRALGLCFGAIDLILSAEGEYVFLEINPNGQWGWIQHLAGLPIGDAIAELLIRGILL
jgi:glutathione synthase/RimK-type ligase-like ATP-grasp enzyme